MTRDKIKIRNIVCIIVSILLACVVAFVAYRNNQKEKAQTDAIEALQEEAKPYEDELQALRSELDDLENSVAYVADEAGIMVGFVLSDVSDLSYIEDKAETYHFTPVLVFDCTMELSEIADFTEAADENWEIMLYASTFSEERNDDVLSVLSYLETVGREQTGVFFLRTDYSSDENIQLLADDGFIGYTSYHSDTPLAGQTEDGLIYFDYSYLMASGSSVTSRLASLYSRKSTMIVTFDMASIDSGALSEEYVVSLMDTLQNYSESGDCSFITTADAVQELSGVNAIESDNQAYYEERAAEIQEQIDDLEKTIAEIYRNL